MESCTEAVDQLDLQRERVEVAFADLRLVLKAFHEGRQDLADYMLSEEFKAQLMS